MKKFDLGQTTQILANIGVLAGILFLAVELRQNGRLLISQAQYTAASLEIDLANEVAVNAELADLLSRARSGTALTEAEENRIRSRARAVFLGWQWAYQQIQAGNLEDDGILERRVYNHFRGVTPLSESTLEEAWDSYDEGFDPDFVDWVNVIRSRL